MRNFNSQICTTIEQSERLIALGLKKETADMALVPLMVWDDCTAQEYFTGIYTARAKEDAERYGLDYTPAWSLGRLLELIKHSDICNYNDFGCIKLYIDLDDFEICITMISYMVKEGYFNKEYLV